MHGARRRRLDRRHRPALEWFAAHPHVDEILITGGDPLVQSNRWLERLLDKVAALEHVYRIRIGTRTPVVLPSRWTEETVALLGKFHEPGRRQVCVVTHFAHPYEITPDAQLASASPPTTRSTWRGRRRPDQ